MTIQAILNSKGTQVETALPTETIATIVDRLRAKKIGALVVSTDGSTVSGIISERDIIRVLSERGNDALDRQVQDVMTRNVVSAKAGDSVRDVMEIMTERRIRHLPVVEDGVLKGIISIGDVVKVRLEQVESEAHALRDYIAGG